MHRIVASSEWSTASSQYHRVDLAASPDSEEGKAFAARLLLPAVKRVGVAIRAASFALLLSMALPLAAQTGSLDTQAPSVPAGLTGTAVSTTQINLTWNASTDNVGVKGYYVYLNDVALGTTTMTSFQHIGLVAGTTYNYRVSAYDAVPNHSAWTATPVAVKTLVSQTDTQAPSVPTGLAAERITKTKVRLNWSASTDNVGVTGYIVYVNDVQRATTTTTSFLHTGFAASFSTNKYRVRAFDAIPNLSALTAPVSVTTTLFDTTPPSVPTGLTGTAVSSSQINLTWNASTDNVGVAGYRVYRTGTLLATLGAVTNYQNTGLSASSNYSYTVQAIDAAGNASAQSASASATTQAASATTQAAPDTVAPSVPTGLTGTAVSTTQINLTWNASTDNVGVKGYYVYLNNVALGTTTMTSFQHIGLVAGTTYNYRVSAYDAVPNHSAWTATPISVTTTGTPPVPAPDTISWSCTFPDSAITCGFQEQAKVSGRAGIINLARDGSTSVRLHTEPGDNNVTGSGDMERDDLWLTQADTDGYEGREQWWAHSILLPDDFSMPTWQMYVLFDFHNTTSGAGQANFHVNTDPNGNLVFRGYGGATNTGGQYGAVIGKPQKNVWYDFVYHVKWSSAGDGFFDAWVNGKRYLAHQGPTLYAGQGVYLKLANYHTPVCDPYPACIGTHPPSSVIHDRVIRGSTALSVSSGPLEGVLTLVGGVLTASTP